MGHTYFELFSWSTAISETNDRTWIEHKKKHNKCVLSGTETRGCKSYKVLIDLLGVLISAYGDRNRDVTSTPALTAQ